MKSKTLEKMIGMSLSLVLIIGTLVGCGSQKEIENTPEESIPMEEANYVPEGYTLTWSDEFEEGLDPNKWAFQLGDGGQYGLLDWGNSEMQYYTDAKENVSVENGMLAITALKETSNLHGHSYSSARLRTMSDEGEIFVAPTFGYIEARMSLPVGDGLWPAFWMLPVDTSIYGEWAASGELDIMEAKGRLPGQVGGTAHFGQAWPNNTYKTADYHFDQDTDISDFHTYALEWTPDTLKWYVDGNCYHELNDWYAKTGRNSLNYTNPAPFDVPFYIILNLAVGGTYDPEAILKSESFPATMLVDYVRVYEKNEGYKETMKTANEKNVEEDIIAKVLEEKATEPNGNMVHNGSFDQGVAHLGFWEVEGDAHVDPWNTDRKLTFAGPGSLTQTGKYLEKGSTYGVRFTVTSESDYDITLSFVNENGDTLHTESIAITPQENYVYVVKFENPKDCDNASLILSFPEEANGSMDDVIMMKLQ